MSKANNKEIANVFYYPGPREKKLRVEVSNTLPAIDRHASDWDRLALEAPQRLPTLSCAWVTSYIENLLLPGETWHCIFAFDDERLVGLLPVIVTPHRLIGLSRPRLRTPHNKHSFSVDFLTAQNYESYVIPSLWDALKRIHSAAYDFSLYRLPDVSPTLSVLNTRAKDYVAIKEFDGDGSYLKIESTFDQYRRGLGHNFIRNLTKARNKLARLPAVKAVFLGGADATDKELALFTRVEASGWKSAAGTAILNSPVLVSFYTALARRFSRLGWLEWHFLQTEDRVMAAQLAVRMKRTLVILKIGYDEEFASCSPGNMLFERTIERAYMLNDIDEINCLTDMAWHDNWEMSKRPHYNLWIYPKRPLSILIGAFGRRTKLSLRRLPGVFPAFRRLRGLMKGNNDD
jgi:hypothetical protein